MKFVKLAIMALLGGVGQAAADPITEASFVTGLSVCLNFGNDAWFAADRLEGAGWHGQYDDYYQAKIYTSPDGSAWVIPPGEGDGFPAWCTVFSSSVGPDYAEFAVRSVLASIDLGFSEYDNEGCYGFHTALRQQILVYSDGQDDFCNDPTSARVNVIWHSDPVAGQ
ncbi:hypothetical protein [Aliiroseovarius sp.]|uniref:hypothetical protein n=1 Tax=Aliiroseovarius sp. TaxID=1872442 RepID=UPI003BA85270